MSTILVFEGMPGSGKSTASKFLNAQFGYPVIRDPGCTPWGEYLRDGLLNRKDIDICATAQVLAFASARAQSAEVVKAVAASDPVVICDRWWPSTWCYQGAHLDKDGKPAVSTGILDFACEHVGDLDAFAELGHRAYLVFFDVSWDNMVKRRPDSGASADRFDEKRDYLRVVYDRYQQLWRDGYFSFRIDANGDEAQLFAQLGTVLNLPGIRG